MHVEKLRNKLKSVTKLKLTNEVNLLKLRKTERSLVEEITTTKSEIEYFNEQMLDLKDQLTQVKNQISMIDICKSSEAAKANFCSENMRAHKQCFDDLFNKESSLFEIRNQEIKKQELAEAELQRQKEEETMKKNEEIEREAATVDAEACAIEKECAVLRKRNTAIMIKLRKKLIETENNRRELMKNIETEK